MVVVRRCWPMNECRPPHCALNTCAVCNEDCVTIFQPTTTANALSRSLVTLREVFRKAIAIIT